MAAYPSFYQTLSSSEKWIDNVQLERASNGSLYGRSFWSAMKPGFDIEHELNTTDVATFKTFYNNNRTVPFDFTWARDGQVYSCMFVGQPQLVPMGGVWWKVRLALEVV